MIELQPSGVTFVKATHQYFRDSDGKELRGITSTLVKRAFPSDYDGIPEETLRRAAERGTRIHEAIEDYEGEDAFADLPELDGYLAIKAGHHLAHERSEYIVTDGKEYASAIDLVMTDDDGGIVLADIKTTYDKHYEKVALQLSIYKRFFELQNPGLKVSKIALVWLRGEQKEYRELSPWAEEALDALIKADREGAAFDIATTYGDLPARFAAVEDEVARLELAVKAAKERQEELRRGLYDLMAEKDVKSFTGSRVKLTRVLPTVSKTFDSKKFKDDHPDLYEEYVKPVQKAGSLRITLV